MLTSLQKIIADTVVKAKLTLFWTKSPKMLVIHNKFYWSLSQVLLPPRKIICNWIKRIWKTSLLIASLQKMQLYKDKDLRLMQQNFLKSKRKKINLRIQRRQKLQSYKNWNRMLVCILQLNYINRFI